MLYSLTGAERLIFTSGAMHFNKIGNSVFFLSVSQERFLFLEVEKTLIKTGVCKLMRYPPQWVFTVKLLLNVIINKQSSIIMCMVGVSLLAANHILRKNSSWVSFRYY